jgi:DNA ligase-1
VSTIRSHGHGSQPLLRTIYDTQQVFGVTPKGVLAYAQTHTANPRNAAATLRDLLTALSEREVTGHAALQAVADFLEAHPGHREVILSAVAKDLKMRAGAKVINRAFPNLIPQASCALGHSLDNHKAFFEKHRASFFASRKLDGVRCKVRPAGETCRAESRSGKEYPAHIPGLQDILRCLAPPCLDGQVLDGEMTVIDETSGREHFPLTNSLMTVSAREDGKRSKNALQLGAHHRLVYQVFDLLPADVDAWRQPGPIFTERQKRLRAWHAALPPTAKQIVHLVEQHPPEAFEALWARSVRENWEGLIYRRNTRYVGKKSRDILKQKLVHDAEYEVLATEDDRLMPPGSTEGETVCARFCIEHKGCRVWVGSGFTWADRVRYKKQDATGGGQSALVGQHVTVSYTEEILSSDDGQPTSLRFPRVKAFHGAQRQA